MSDAHLRLPTEPSLIRQTLRAHADAPEDLDSTISKLSSELSRLDEERARYDTKIDDLRAALATAESGRAALVAQRAAVQADLDDCQVLRVPSAVKRLPVEVLIPILRLASPSYRPQYAYWADAERHHLAHIPLFALSRVCARWHAIVMGTPELWSTIDFPDTLWSGLRQESLMLLLKKVLKLSGKSVLDLVLPRGATTVTKVLNLFMRHSERWRTVSFTGPSVDLARLFTGNLPLLESLELHVDNRTGGDTPNLLGSAPKLTHLVVSESMLHSMLGPYLPQLQILECVGVKQPKVALAVNLMTHLSTGAKCRLELHLGVHRGIPYLAPILSRVGTLSVECSQNATDIKDLFDNLTLPDLLHLTLRSGAGLTWPHAAFLGLSSRSSFHAHLHTLDISDFGVIGAAQLTECLSFLPALQRLEISDDERVPPMLTEDFLVDLTTTPLLLPALRHLICRRSRLAFRDGVLLNFILSRVQSGDGKFEMGLYWMNAWRRAIESGVSVRIDKLRKSGALVWTFAQAEEL
ncbi:hypothetical protein FB45DRAFT_899491 [Roridomyces roridus]|uniref:F-box domain-containing protein n=1 Tax=Roridomyces roridus TaxID=1738132 RepID=A0AAD7C785_9AGAR|nr:hypothetical protein FB45DRAFT_899491 [Roridomyces roridus]